MSKIQLLFLQSHFQLHHPIFYKQNLYTPNLLNFLIYLNSCHPLTSLTPLQPISDQIPSRIFKNVTHSLTIFHFLCHHPESNVCHFIHKWKQEGVSQQCYIPGGILLKWKEVECSHTNKTMNAHYVLKYTLETINFLLKSNQCPVLEQIGSQIIQSLIILYQVLYRHYKH